VNDLFYCRVPLHKSEASSKGIHLLHSQMSSLNYLTEPPHNFAVDDVNARAFELATKIIGGRNTIEEFLACSILPFSDNWDLKVEKAEAPLSKVVAPLLKAPTMKVMQETDADFDTRVAKSANRLVGNYSLTEQ
jgi:hypothetical protein